MPIINGWEISPDRTSFFEKLSSKYDLGDPILTSKCARGKDNGLLIVSDRGFAWKLKPGMNTSRWNYGDNMWIRWHDLFGIIPKKPGVILLQVKKRNMKTKELVLDKKGEYTFKKWKFILVKNAKEDKIHYLNRKQTFNELFNQIWADHRTEGDPPQSDSNY